MRRLLGMFLVLGMLLISVSGCDLLDRLYPNPDPNPDCPYPGVVCDLLGDLDFDGISDRIDGIRDCLTDD